MDVIGCGALNIDQLYKVESMAQKDEEVPIKDSYEQPGGSAANTIYALGKLGLKTGFIGVVGDDNNARTVLSSLEEVGVDISNIRAKSRSKTGLVIGMVDEKGERSLFIAPGANNLLEFDDVDMNHLNSARFLHLTSFVKKTQLEVQRRMVDALGDDTQLSFAPGSLYVKKGYDALSSILNKAHILFLNEVESRILTSMDSHEKATEFLIEEGCNIVVITLGDKGCFVTDGNEYYFVNSKKTHVVDTTGAGDSFTAGFLYGLLQDWDLKRSAIAGNILASKCISSLGARSGLPTLEQLENELDDY